VSASGRAIQTDSEFWVRQGGLALVQHLWTHAEPPAGTLDVVEASRDLVEAAYRSDAEPPG
jgi:hypothetical protein